MIRLVGVKQMREVLGGDDEIILVLISAFLKEYKGLLGDLELAVSNGESRAIENAAHTIKGAVSNFHAEPVRSLAQEIEANGRSGDVESAKYKTIKLLNYLRRWSERWFSFRVLDG